MSKQYYSKNSIQEALIDIQLEEAGELSKTAVEGFERRVHHEYPKKHARHLLHTTFHLKEGKPTQSQNHLIDGYEIFDNNRIEVLQIKRGGFSFSRLSPYEKWETHFPKFEKYWNIYREQFNPGVVKRLAVRFINVFQIPEVKVELSDYIAGVPNTPKGLPQQLDEFLVRLVVPFETGAKGIITFAPGQNAKAGHVNIVLDIDVFINTRVRSSDSFLKDFESLHHFADDIFESCITDKMRDLIR